MTQEAEKILELCKDMMAQTKTVDPQKKASALRWAIYEISIQARKIIASEVT